MDMDQTRGASVAYLAHDVNDAAVRRRTALFLSEGFAVVLGGFRRHGEATPVALVGFGSDAPSAIDLGRTKDADLVQRMLSVLRNVVLPGKVRRVSRGASVIVARNLEMLALAARVRAPGQRLVYECLDIHRIMLANGLVSRMMRWVERLLLARTNLIIVSSPAFAEHYFGRRQNRWHDLLLVENKVPGQGRSSPDAYPLPRPPAHERSVRTIGWFGMLRCRKSLAQLAEIARTAPRGIEVLIAGIPSPAEFPDFTREVERHPGLRFVGAFSPADLPHLYAEVDFIWAVDYFEEGLNSRWLLPNRLYEGLANRAIPIALRGVQTGEWLRRHEVGLLVDDPVRELPELLRRLTLDDLERMRAAISALPEEELYQTRDERRRIAVAIAGAKDV